MPPRYEKRRGHKRDIGWLVKAGAKTRVITFVNVGSYAHTMSDSADVNTLDLTTSEDARKNGWAMPLRMSII